MKSTLFLLTLFLFDVGFTDATVPADMNLSIKPIESEIMLGQPILLKLAIKTKGGVQGLDLGYNRFGNVSFKSPDGKIFNYASSDGGISRVPTISITPDTTYSQFLLLDEWTTMKTLGDHSLTGFLKNTPSMKASFAIKIVPFDSKKMETWVLGKIQEIKSSKDTNERNILMKALERVPSTLLVGLKKSLSKEQNNGATEIISQVLQSQNKIVTD